MSEQLALRLVVDNDWRVCSKCRVPKPESEYGALIRGKFTRAACKQCDNKQRRDKYQSDLEAEGSDGGMTYKQIGAVMGITAEGVRLIEMKALRKLRNNSITMAAVRRALEGR